jgi:hypothetical protein
MNERSKPRSSWFLARRDPKIADIADAKTCLARSAADTNLLPRLAAYFTGSRTGRGFHFHLFSRCQVERGGDAVRRAFTSSVWSTIVVDRARVDERASAFTTNMCGVVFALHRRTMSPDPSATTPSP